jgi:hypothetical protein
MRTCHANLLTKRIKSDFTRPEPGWVKQPYYRKLSPEAQVTTVMQIWNGSPFCMEFHHYPLRRRMNGRETAFPVGVNESVWCIIEALTPRDVHDLTR